MSLHPIIGPLTPRSPLPDLPNVLAFIPAWLPFPYTTDKLEACRNFSDSLSCLQRARVATARYLALISTVNGFPPTVGLPHTSRAVFRIPRWYHLAPAPFWACLEGELLAELGTLIGDFRTGLRALSDRQLVGNVQFSCPKACTSTVVHQVSKRGGGPPGAAGQRATYERDLVEVACLGIDDPTVEIPDRALPLVAAPDWLRPYLRFLVGAETHRAVTAATRTERHGFRYGPVVLGLVGVALTGWVPEEIEAEEVFKRSRAENSRRELEERLVQAERASVRSGRVRVAGTLAACLAGYLVIVVLLVAFWHPLVDAVAPLARLLRSVLLSILGVVGLVTLAYWTDPDRTRDRLRALLRAVRSRGRS